MVLMSTSLHSTVGAVEYFIYMIILITVLYYQLIVIKCFFFTIYGHSALVIMVEEIYKTQMSEIQESC